MISNNILLDTDNFDPRKQGAFDLLDVITQNGPIRDSESAYRIIDSTNKTLIFLEYGLEAGTLDETNEEGFREGAKEIIRACRLSSLRVENYLLDILNKENDAEKETQQQDDEHRVHSEKGLSDLIDESLHWIGFYITELNDFGFPQLSFQYENRFIEGKVMPVFKAVIGLLEDYIEIILPDWKQVGGRKKKKYCHSVIRDQLKLKFFLEECNKVGFRHIDKIYSKKSVNKTCKSTLANIQIYLADYKKLQNHPAES